MPITPILPSFYHIGHFSKQQYDVEDPHKCHYHVTGWSFKSVLIDVVRKIHYPTSNSMEGSTQQCCFACLLCFWLFGCMKPKFWMDIGNSIAFNFDVATCLYHAHITLFIQVLLPIKKSKKKKKKG